MFSAGASGAPQPMPPDSSFRLHMRRRITTLAVSMFAAARVATVCPMAVIACQRMVSLPCTIPANRGLSTVAGGSWANSARIISISSDASNRTSRRFNSMPDMTMFR